MKQENMAILNVRRSNKNDCKDVTIEQNYFQKHSNESIFYTICGIILV